MRSLALACALVAACAPANGARPAEPRTLEDVIAPGEIWDETQPALATMLHNGVGGGVFSMPYLDESLTCALFEREGSYVLDCGEVFVAAQSLGQIVIDVNEGRFHRYVTLSRLRNPRYLKVLLGPLVSDAPPQATSDTITTIWLAPPLGAMQVEAFPGGDIAAQVTMPSGDTRVGLRSFRAFAEELTSLRRRADEEDEERRYARAIFPLFDAVLSAITVQGDEVRFDAMPLGKPPRLGGARLSPEQGPVGAAFPARYQQADHQLPCTACASKSTLDLRLLVLDGRLVAVAHQSRLSLEVPSLRLAATCGELAVHGASQLKSLAVPTFPGTDDDQSCRFSLTLTSQIDLEVTVDGAHISLDLRLGRDDFDDLEASAARASRDAARKARCDACSRLRPGQALASKDRVQRVDSKTCSVQVRSPAGQLSTRPCAP